jgi:hypothetical protein
MLLHISHKQPHQTHPAEMPGGWAMYVVWVRNSMNDKNERTPHTTTAPRNPKIQTPKNLNEKAANKKKDAPRRQKQKKASKARTASRVSWKKQCIPLYVAPRTTPLGSAVRV